MYEIMLLTERNGMGFSSHGTLEVCSDLGGVLGKADSQSN